MQDKRIVKISKRQAGQMIYSENILYIVFSSLFHQIFAVCNSTLFAKLCACAVCKFAIDFESMLKSFLLYRTVARTMQGGTFDVEGYIEYNRCELIQV